MPVSAPSNKRRRGESSQLAGREGGAGQRAVLTGPVVGAGDQLSDGLQPQDLGLGDPMEPDDDRDQLRLAVPYEDFEKGDEDEEEEETADEGETEEEGSGGHNEQERALRHKVEQYDRSYALKVHSVKQLGQVQRQHLMNLTAMMRQYAATRNISRLAQVAALLLGAQTTEKTKLRAGELQQGASEAQARLAEVLATGYAALTQGWPVGGSTATGAPPTYDQLKRLLRQAHAFQPSAAARDGVALELARLALAKGELGEAYDVLEAMPQRSAGAALEFDRALLTGLVRHVQWIQAMQRSERRHTAAPAVNAEGIGFDAFGFSPSQWARAGRVARELFQEAGEHLQRAYQLRPGCTELAYVLVQRALVTDGGVRAAAQVALRHRQLAPADVDAHALHALLLVMGASLATSASAKGAAGGGPGNPTSGGMPAWLAELVGCLEAMLRCDPGNPVAFEAAMKIHEAGALPASAMLRLLSAYLDVVPPSLNPGPDTLQAWRLLADYVCEASRRLVHAHSTVQHTQQALRRHLAVLLPGAQPLCYQPQQEQQQQQEEEEEAEHQQGGTGHEAGDGPTMQTAGDSPAVQRQACAHRWNGPDDATDAGELLPDEGRQGEGLSSPSREGITPGTAGHGRRGADAGAAVLLHPEQADELYLALGQQQRDLEAALQQWGEVVRCLQGCLWWRQQHFVSPRPEHAVLALRSGRASPEGVQAQAVVAAAVHGLWVQQRLQAVRHGGRLPLSLRNDFTRGMMRALRQHGAAATADSVRQAYKEVTHALRIARARDRQPGCAVLGVLAHQARQRVDFWRAAQRQQRSPPSGRLSIPLGLPHPQLGPVADLPPTWWQAFPQARRTNSTSAVLC